MTRSAKSVPAQHTAPESNIKETIESILIAFVLAFIFRAFVVEAFVIPTGSMAPTLMGAHMRFTCPDCGYHYEVNYPTSTDADDSMRVPAFARLDKTNEDQVFALYCPNCGYKLPRHDPLDPANSATAPPVRYGDRILVLKYLYLFQQPRRWDVVVFKAPPDPIRYDYSINYIKRLTGKPGESIMLLDGDVYVAPPASDATKLASYVVQTKPQSVQDALWRIVYDNDFHPQGLSRDEIDAGGDVTQKRGHWQQPWKADAGGRGWDLGTELDSSNKSGSGGKSSGAGGNRLFQFNALDGGGAITFDPDANSYKFPLTDWLAYDQVSSDSDRGPADTFNHSAAPGDNNVGDLKLAFTYQRHDGAGPLVASLTKISRTFSAEIFPDHVALDWKENGSSGVIGTANLALASGQHRIELQNVDYQVTLCVDGTKVIQSTPAQYAPNTQALLDAFNRNIALPKPTVRIDASAQSCTLSHVGLWRDIYYGNRGNQNMGGQPFHASPQNFPENIMHLGDDEYFVLGDNSRISGDARYWSEPIKLPDEGLDVDSGRVPGRFLLGKAFFVYWPAGFRPVDSAPAMAPNFGDMRVIH